VGTKPYRPCSIIAKETASSGHSTTHLAPRSFNRPAEWKCDHGDDAKLLEILDWSHVRRLSSHHPSPSKRHHEFSYASLYQTPGTPADVVKVKQFIRNVRASKTIADERAVVQKESAAIRASFREESHDSNVR
jgi:hypothetical protein